MGHGWERLGRGETGPLTTWKTAGSKVGCFHYKLKSIKSDAIYLHGLRMKENIPWLFTVVYFLFSPPRLFVFMHLHICTVLLFG